MKLKELIKRMYATARICIFDAEFNSQVVYRENPSIYRKNI